MSSKTSAHQPNRNAVTVTVENVSISGIDRNVTVHIECEMEDHGIGCFEFWGAPCVDVQWCAVATGATLEDGTPIDVDLIPEDVRQKAEDEAFEEARIGDDF